MAHIYICDLCQGVIKDNNSAYLSLDIESLVLKKHEDKESADDTYLSLFITKRNDHIMKYQLCSNCTAKILDTIRIIKSNGNAVSKELDKLFIKRS